jgi:proline iminopeptidase
LAEHRTVYAIDLPGFGRSSRVPYKGSSTEDAEEWFLRAIEDWRKSAGVNSPFTLLGHSFGAYLAGVYALKHPNNISHLILADP